jgi:hypothetical protein
MKDRDKLANPHGMSYRNLYLVDRRPKYMDAADVIIPVYNTLETPDITAKRVVASVLAFSRASKMIAKNGKYNLKYRHLCAIVVYCAPIRSFMIVSRVRIGNVIKIPSSKWRTACSSNSGPRNSGNKIDIAAQPAPTNFTPPSVLKEVARTGNMTVLPEGTDCPEGGLPFGSFDNVSASAYIIGLVDPTNPNSQLFTLRADNVYGDTATLCGPVILEDQIDGRVEVMGIAPLSGALGLVGIKHGG